MPDWYSAVRSIWRPCRYWRAHFWNSPHHDRRRATRVRPLTFIDSTGLKVRVLFQRQLDGRRVIIRTHNRTCGGFSRSQPSLKSSNSTRRSHRRHLVAETVVSRDSRQRMARFATRLVHLKSRRLSHLPFTARLEEAIEVGRQCSRILPTRLPVVASSTTSRTTRELA